MGFGFQWRDSPFGQAIEKTGSPSGWNVKPEMVGYCTRDLRIRGSIAAGLPKGFRRFSNDRLIAEAELRPSQDLRPLIIRRGALDAKITIE
ncbi:MAG: hypothetical protein ACI8UO_004752 [Verrucomicrobiales bacterium]|jgi:hypothetical protein